MGRFETDKDQPILPWVNEFYKKVFPRVKSCFAVTDADLQKAGIDKILRFRKGSLRQSITIDEKIRHNFYNDILLEEYSNYERRTPGWLIKNNTLCDYISYIFEREGIVYLFDYKKLKESWDRNYQRWLEKYGRKFGKTTDRLGNVLYRTSNIPVPLAELNMEYSTNRQRMTEEQPLTKKEFNIRFLLATQPYIPKVALNLVRECRDDIRIFGLDFARKKWAKFVGKEL